MRKIKSSIGLAIFSCTIFISVWVGVMSLNSSRRIIWNECESSMSSIVDKYSAEMNLQFKEYEEVINSTEDYIQVTFDLNQIYNKEYMDNYVEEMAKFLGYISSKNNRKWDVYIDFNPEFLKKLKYVWYSDGKRAYLDDIETETEDLLNKSESWDDYYSIKEHKDGLWIKPIYDEYTGNTVLTYGKPVYIDNILVGVIALDIEFNDFADIIDNIKAYDSGYAFMLYGKDEIIYHKDYEISTQLKDIDLLDLENEIESKKSSSIRLKIDDNNYIVNFNTLNNGFVLCIASPIDEVFLGLYKISAATIIILIIGSIVAVIASNKLAQKIS